MRTIARGSMPVTCPGPNSRTDTGGAAVVLTVSETSRLTKFWVGVVVAIDTRPVRTHGKNP